MNPEELDAYPNEGSEGWELELTSGATHDLAEDVLPGVESSNEGSSLGVGSQEVVKLPMRPELERLGKLYALFGNVVVIPIPYGKKGPEGPEAVGWQSVTFEQSQEPDYQNRICECFTRAGNLGLSTGPLSDNLVDIDIDRAEWVQPFLEANPLLQRTLRRVGKRGCGIMLRLVGSYPIGRWELRLAADGTKFGEWRAGGGHQSVVFGRHTDLDEAGKPIFYRIAGKRQVIELRYEQIVFPSWMRHPLPWEEVATPVSSADSEKNTDANLDKRIRAYMAAQPIAVSGQSGHKTTFKVALALIQGWALSPEEARPYFQAYNALCQPPWSDKELEHKLDSAIKAPLEKPYGFLRNKERNNRNVRSDHDNANFGSNSVIPPEENEENEEIATVDWGAFSSNSSNSSGGVPQEVPFPPESILGDYYAYAITQTKGADCYIIGAILPVIAAVLQRNVWLRWANGELCPHLFSLMVGPPGNMKSTSIELPEIIARGVFEYAEAPYFLSHNYSPESLFDAYYQHPHRLLICDDANSTLSKWQSPHEGERLSSNFLALFDGKRLSENFRRNRTEGKLDSQERWTEPTSTNIVFGLTFNGCEFRGNAQRAGLQRRFLTYVAEDTARKVKRPQPDGAMVGGLIKQFGLLSHLRGAFSWTQESEKLFDEFTDQIDERIRACDILDDRTRGRLTTAAAWVAKIAMIFEASRLCWDAKWMPDDPEIVPTSPALVIHKEILELAIDHVESCLQAANGLDQVANRQRIAEQAQMLLAYVRTKFRSAAKKGSIILNKTQITGSYAHNFGRRSDSPVSDIYERLIPYLIRTGEAQLLVKEGKKEIYAFRVEEPASSITP